MTSLWEIGKSKSEKLADKWEDKGVLEEKISEEKDKFEHQFKQNMNEEVPTHPYKIFRGIVESNELTDEERIALEELKDEYSEKWQSIKQNQSLEEEPAKKVFEPNREEKIPNKDLEEVMNLIVEQIISIESFIPYTESSGDSSLEGRFNFIPKDNQKISEKYFELLNDDSFN